MLDAVNVSGLITNSGLVMIGSNTNLANGAGITNSIGGTIELTDSTGLTASNQGTGTTPTLVDASGRVVSAVSSTDFET
jgi:hypothetical protein